MTGEDMFEQLVERHGWSESDVVKLRASGIKALLNQAYQEGFQEGSDSAYESLKSFSKSPETNPFKDSGNPFTDLFGKFF